VPGNSMEMKREMKMKMKKNVRGKASVEAD
jgi:hypothetical protein